MEDNISNNTAEYTIELKIAGLPSEESEANSTSGSANTTQSNSTQTTTDTGEVISEQEVLSRFDVSTLSGSDKRRYEAPLTASIKKVTRDGKV